MNNIGYMGSFGWFGMILFWSAFIWLIIWLINKNDRFKQKEQTPLHIAKERYAKGELTIKQFENMKQELEV